MTRGDTGLTQRRKRKRKRNDASRSYENLRRLWDTRWTPNNEQLQELIWLAVREAGNRKQLALIVGIKPRHLRRILDGTNKAVSYNVVDRILARSDISYRIRELPWLTVEQLLEQGVWKPQWGKPRVSLPEAESAD